MTEIGEHLNLSRKERIERDKIVAKAIKNKEYKNIPFWAEILDANS